MKLFGFVILSHNSPNQLLRLCDTLTELYGPSPIACHHDFSQSDLDKNLFPANVHFVEKWTTTGWGKWSLVEATLSALKLLYSAADPDFFFVISGADYPTAKVDKVRQDIAKSDADAFIDAFPLEVALRGEFTPGDPHLAHHREPYNLKLERNRYLRAQLKVPILRFRPPQHSTTTEGYPRLGALTLAMPFNTPLSPFDDNYRCYVGSQWFSGNRKVALKLLNPKPKDLQLQRYYQARTNPDESYFQTVICNDSELAFEDRTYRYLIWHGAHPIDLGVNEYNEIIESEAHFSRKFGANGEVLDMIDNYMGLKG